MSKLPVVAIIGLPNVGKSSLFNRLVGRRQAIVYDQPGTTRNRVEGIVEYHGKSSWWVDTAGIEEASDELEQNVQAQITEAQMLASVIVLVADASAPITDELRRIAKTALQSRKPVILIVNKIDKSRKKVSEEYQKLGIKNIIGMSVIHALGLDELLTEAFRLLPKKLAKAEAKMPVIALLGRPNVGKSSVFNALADANKAVVSTTPGTTRDVHSHQLKRLGKDYKLLDTAGLRRRGKAQGIERISWLRTISAIAQADVAVLLIDATEPSVAVDQRIAGLIKEAGKGLIIAINKWDLVKDQDDAQKYLEARLQRDFPFVWWAPVVLTSAQSKHNLYKLLELAQVIYEKRQQKLQTSKLNNLLQTAMAAHPPAGLGNRHPKLKYATQTDVDPPEFTMFGRNLEYLHWSYRRYLEKQLREACDFTGTPIKLIVREDESRQK